jgi:uncharacterized surface protein with fasciclin (FAS1) repeats
MQLKSIVPLALASQGAAQNLTEALGSQNSSLSDLNGLITSNPSLMEALNRDSNVTLLAPNNDAIRAFLDSSSSGSTAKNDSGLIEALLSYHTLDGTYYASNFTDASRSPVMFIPTRLTNTSYANVTDGQRVEASTVNGNVTFISGLREHSTVVIPVRTPNPNSLGRRMFCYLRC